VFAIVESGGQQFRVAPGSEIEVPRVEGEVGDKVTLSRVLMVGGDDGSCDVGSPALDNVRAQAEILVQGKAPKVLVQKFKRRKNYRRILGHRAHITRLKIVSIGK